MMKSKTMSQQQPTEAIVIGSSMAGLLAARVLSDHFDRVRVIERDQLPEDAAYRGGVSQARHLHLLLARGRAIFTQFFHGFEADFRELGVPTVDVGRDVAAHTGGGWTKRDQIGLQTNLVSRPTIDWYVRQQLRKRDNIEFIAQTEVDDFVTSEDKVTVTGIQTRSHRDTSRRVMLADLVVDASGRGSKTPEWLATMGYPRVPQSRVNAFLGYSSRWYKVPQERNYDWHLMLVNLEPNKGLFHGGGAQIVEDNKLVATLIGVNKHYPPTDEAEFLEFARQLASPALYEIIKELEPISPVYGYRRTENIWNHYETVERFPERLLLVGDAYCCFNPVYGQGMTVAAIEMQRLDTILRSRGAGNLDQLPREFFSALAGIVRNPWLLATGEDLRYPGTEGDRPGWFSHLTQQYVEIIIKALPLDTELGLAFAKVVHLIEPPQSLFHPRIISKVLTYALHGIHADEHLNAPITSVKARD
ncbi:MAG: FAD-dependent monooxygenase [Anaerolineae bacterium]|nr:FAD-dependent monooxygenase [Anaerolineae bacterium]